LGRSIGGKNGYRDALLNTRNGGRGNSTAINEVSTQSELVRAEGGVEGIHCRIGVTIGSEGRRDQTERNINQLNLNTNQQQIARVVALREEGINNRIEYTETPRTVRPVNRPQSYPRGSRNNDAVRDQQRAVRWRAQKTLQVRKNKQGFTEGADQLLVELIPTHPQIVKGMNKRQLTSNEAATAGSDQLIKEAEVRHSGRTNKDFTIRELLEQWQGGAHGYVPEVKGDNTIRLACKNVNSLSLHKKGAPKSRKLLNLVSRHQVDEMCIVEHGMNFRHVESKGDKSQDGIFASMNTVVEPWLVSTNMRITAAT
jgi:hypothetical protein